MKKRRKYSDERAAKLMAAYNNELDTERAHAWADDLLCELLKDLGYVKTVKAFEDLDKWYA